MCLHVCLHACVLSYFSMCTWICHYMYLSTYLLHVFAYLLTTCTCPHTHHMYLSAYSLHVLVYILTTCTCLHTYYMYLSTGDQSEVISTDPKIAPVNDQLSVYGERTNSVQMVQNYNC